jgi:hypothetical protein
MKFSIVVRTVDDLKYLPGFLNFFPHPHHAIIDVYVPGPNIQNREWLSFMHGVSENNMVEKVIVLQFDLIKINLPLYDAVVLLNTTNAKTSWLHKYSRKIYDFTTLSASTWQFKEIGKNYIVPVTQHFVPSIKRKQYVVDKFSTLSTATKKTKIFIALVDPTESRPIPSDENRFEYCFVYSAELTPCETYQMVARCDYILNSGVNGNNVQKALELSFACLTPLIQASALFSTRRLSKTSSEDWKKLKHERDVILERNTAVFWSALPFEKESSEDSEAWTINLICFCENPVMNNMSTPKHAARKVRVWESMNSESTVVLWTLENLTLRIRAQFHPKLLKFFHSRTYKEKIFLASLIALECNGGACVSIDYTPVKDIRFWTFSEKELVVIKQSRSCLYPCAMISHQKSNATLFDVLNRMLPFPFKHVEVQQICLDEKHVNTRLEGLWLKKDDQIGFETFCQTKTSHNNTLTSVFLVLSAVLMLGLIFQFVRGKPSPPRKVRLNQSVNDRVH